MTDLFAYHLAKQQLADLRRTAGETRLVSTARGHGAVANSRTLVGGLLTRFSSAVRIGQPKPGVASQTAAAAPDSLTNPAREL